MLASQYGQRVILIDLVSSVVANYILLLQYENQRQIAVSTLDSRRESTRIIQARYDRGTVAEIDLNQAQIQEEIAAASIPFFERQIAVTENTLAVLLGRNPRSILKGDLDSLVTPPIIPPGLPSELLVRRPDLMQQYHLLAAQNEYVGVAVANRLPNISLNGLFGVASNDIGMLFTADGVVWSVGGGLLQPIFQFGKNLRRVDIEKARLQQQLKTYENTVIEAFAEVEDALVNVETYDRELEARRRQRTAADNANRLSKLRYDGGQTSYLEVLEQERSLFEAELSTSEVHAFYLLSYVDLYKALGGGWLSEEEKEASEAIERAIEAEVRERESGNE
jgi:multidrug efflux system outer membrane protein